MEILFATSNPHKLSEAREILEPAGVIVKQVRIEYPEIRADDVIEVAREGALYVSSRLKKAVIVEDTGLFIKSLRGFPGIYSKYVLNTIGKQGILKLMRDIGERYAEFRCCIGFCKPEIKPITFTGIVRGKIATEIRGSYGFGYDPIFIPENSTKTYGEMRASEKNRISHRKKAFMKFLNWVEGDGKDIILSSG